MTPKRQLFVEAFLGRANMNATKAAELAGYSDAKNEGYRLKQDPEVQEAIKQRLEEEAMSAREVLYRLAEQARADVDEFLDEEGCFDIEKARAAGKTHLLKELSYEEVYEGGGRDRNPDLVRKVKFKIHDPQAALVHIGRHQKLFTDKHEHGGVDGAPLKVYLFNPEERGGGDTDGGDGG